MTNRRSIGMDRRVDQEWLDAAAGYVAADMDAASVRDALFALLEGVVQGDKKRGTARYKTVSVLSRIWSNTFPDVRGLRDRAVKLLPGLALAPRLGLHWSLLMATYPFFADVATNTGRLLSLQGNLTLAQLTRRMQEAWGDRSTMARAAQRVIRSMVQWGALADGEQPGIYLAAKKPIEVLPAVGELLLESLLIHLEGGGLPVDQALRHPSFFPFRLKLGVHHIRSSGRFDIHRQGLDVDVVTLEQGQARNGR